MSNNFFTPQVKNLRHFSISRFLFQKINIYLYSTAWNGLLLISNTPVFCLASSQLNLSMKIAWYRSIPLQAVGEVPLLNKWVWQSISYPRWTKTSQLDWDSDFSLGIRICSPSILPFLLGRVLTYAKALDLVETCTQICSIIFPLIVSVLVTENHNITSHS